MSVINLLQKKEPASYIINQSYIRKGKNAEEQTKDTKPTIHGRVKFPSSHLLIDTRRHKNHARNTFFSFFFFFFFSKKKLWYILGLENEL